MASNQATAADVQARSLRDLTVEEQAWALVRLKDAFAQILATVPGAAARLDTGTVTSPYNQLVIQVQAAMVLRVLANPDYVRQQGVDDATTILDVAVSSGALYLTDQERSLLTVSTAGATAGAANVRAAGWRDRGPGWWLAHGTTTL